MGRLNGREIVQPAYVAAAAFSHAAASAFAPLVPAATESDRTHEMRPATNH